MLTVDCVKFVKLALRLYRAWARPSRIHPAFRVDGGADFCTPRPLTFADVLCSLLWSVLFEIEQQCFGFLSGRVKRCPPWVGRIGFEWAYRLLAEPRKLWRRDFLQAPRFLILVPSVRIIVAIRSFSCAGRCLPCRCARRTAPTSTEVAMRALIVLSLLLVPPAVVRSAR